MDFDWPKDDQVRWVEWEIRRITAKTATSGLDRIALEIWLSKVRDEFPWHQVALKCYGSKNSASISKARRAYNRVQRLHPGVAQKPRLKPGPKPKEKN
jgi:hypothetical protein